MRLDMREGIPSGFIGTTLISLADFVCAFSGEEKQARHFIGSLDRGQVEHSLRVPLHISELFLVVDLQAQDDLGKGFHVRQSRFESSKPICPSPRVHARR